MSRDPLRGLDTAELCAIAPSESLLACDASESCEAANSYTASYCQSIEYLEYLECSFADIADIRECLCDQSGYANYELIIARMIQIQKSQFIIKSVGKDTFTIEVCVVKSCSRHDR
jgi:hypothetical protein